MASNTSCIPIIPNYTEEEILELIQNICKRLSPKYVFGVYDKEDIEQEGFLIAIKALKGYSNQAPLTAFLYTHIKCRMKNFKRDNSVRPTVICNNCSAFDPYCESCVKRENNERAKFNLSYPLDINKVDIGRFQEDNTDIANISELLLLINKNLPVSMRADYLKIKDNIYIPKKRKEEVQNKVLEIIGIIDG